MHMMPRRGHKERSVLGKMKEGDLFEWSNKLYFINKRTKTRIITTKMCSYGFIRDSWFTTEDEDTFVVTPVDFDGMTIMYEV